MMNVPNLSTHLDAALALYRQRRQQQQATMVDAEFVARQEQQLRSHLHVLSRCAPLAMTPVKEADHFIDLSARMLALSTTVRLKGCDLALSQLGGPGPARQGAFQALALVPPPETDDRMLELYRQNKALRPLLFDLWREQARPVPPGLVNVAELRGHGTALQIAALRYAASQPAIGIELFGTYYQGLFSGAARPDKSGHLLATALWGGLLRGERKLAKPLWRCIESETDPANLYHLLRLAAIMALPEIIPVLKHHGEQHPESAAELLALHGTETALQALMDLSRTGEDRPGVLDAWQWVSGKRLVPGPHLKVAPPEGETAVSPAPDTIAHWWRQHAPLEDGQRLIMGEILTNGHLVRRCRAWAGRFSRNLLDLLSYTIGSPLGVSADALQQRRLSVIEEKTRGMS
jgi:hypothetical protein